MNSNLHLYEKALDVRRQDLRLEMEERRLLAYLPKRKRRSMSRRAAGKLGVLLLKLGMWLKQLEHPYTALED